LSVVALASTNATKLCFCQIQKRKIARHPTAKATSPIFVEMDSAKRCRLAILAKQY
jgi:hypothetical protein